MQFSTIAAMRFGYGLSPLSRGAQDPAALLAGLREPDALAARYPVITPGEGARMLASFAPLKRAERANEPGAAEALLALKRTINTAIIAGLQAQVARAVADETGLRERLYQFWRDHFTVRARRQRQQGLMIAHGEEAVRPHLTGRFADMLTAAVTHPAMVVYLDQSVSIGPGSVRARKRPDRGLGLNENLAREVIELHTLGVGGSYGQHDVRELAELFTGMTHSEFGGFQFLPDYAEPGAETVLGKTFGGDPAKLADVEAALVALARHPDTAQHLARKLAVHFVADRPDPALVAALATAYEAADTDLMAVYEVLATHPAAAMDPAAKVRQPFEFIVTSLRALGLSGDDVMALGPRDLRRYLYGPLRLMGQRWNAPGGPDGWPEAAEDWIVPQLLAARIEWAMTAPAKLVGPLPDPRGFIDTALAEAASDALRFAVPRAESRAEGVGLVLASPEFNRR